MVIALGIAWILDGLEITLAADVADILEKKQTLAMSPRAVGDIASVYLIGEVFGAIIFGRLSDKLGRKRLFLVTLGVYLIGSGSDRRHLWARRRVGYIPVRHSIHCGHGHWW